MLTQHQEIPIPSEARQEDFEWMKDATKEELPRVDVTRWPGIENNSLVETHVLLKELKPHPHLQTEFVKKVAGIHPLSFAHLATEDAQIAAVDKLLYLDCGIKNVELISLPFLLKYAKTDAVRDTILKRFPTSESMKIRDAATDKILSRL